MIKLKVQYGLSGSGLGYQTSSYVFIKTIAKHFGYQTAVGKYELLNLRNTFENVKFDNCESKTDEEYENEFSFLDGLTLDEIMSSELKDDSVLVGYPKTANFYHPTYFEEIRKDLVFRKIIRDKCNEFMYKFPGQEIISMHIRRGDIADPMSGVFLSGDEYFLEALNYFPEDAKVFIFTNDKEYVRSNPNFQGDRFVLITDIFNDNELINCDWGNAIDERLDISGASRFYYKYVISKLAEENNISVNDILKELHPKYLYKIKNNLYNLSFDLCLMSMCDYHIMSNSTYGMWGVALSNTKHAVYPKYWMQSNPKDDVLVRDLNGYNQTKELVGPFIKDSWTALENPDSRVPQVEG